MLDSRPRIVILTAIHGRWPVVEAALRHVQGLRPRLADLAVLEVHAVASEEDPALGPKLQALGVDFEFQPNRPVSRKWQRGLDTLRQASPPLDGLLVLGSDDFASEAYLRLAIGSVKDWTLPDACGPDAVWFYDALGPVERLGWWKGPMVAPGLFRMPAGAGRLFTRGFLDAVAWSLWPFYADDGLDGKSSAHLAREKQRIRILTLDRQSPAFVLDVKGDGNIHAWDAPPYKAVLEGPAARRTLVGMGLGHLAALRPQTVPATAAVPQETLA